MSEDPSNDFKNNTQPKSPVPEAAKPTQLAEAGFDAFNLLEQIRWRNDIGKVHALRWL